MISKITSYGEIEPAIRAAFLNDKNIFKFYDNNANVESLDELIADVMKKIKGYENTFPSTKFYLVVEKGQAIGYFVVMEEALISFGLSVQYRQRKYLKQFFSLIRKELKGRFCCTLWSRNIRAVKYLMKNGLKIIDTNPHLTTLIY